MTETLNLNWQTGEVTPTLLQGEDALMLYNSLPEQARNEIKYDPYCRLVTGSNAFVVAILDTEVQKYNARTPNLRDLSMPEIMRIARYGHYIYSRNLVVRSTMDLSTHLNNNLLKQIYELAEEKEGRINLPFMIEGYTFIENPEDKTGYGLSIVARPDFKVIQDERFDGKYNWHTFSEVDTLGLPLFDKKGIRGWYTKSSGLSGVCLDGDLDLVSGSDELSESNRYGRVALVKNN